ncbi:ABC-three component system protein [Acanthopleuribacter pedis]|uniref:ABC-three component systems C-terminal domain-containing protein n=1 Tax=Acanthopleuribacter pedis TaxID=442870 RepID=A0A8J7U4J2_9BACT|nr:ABC-three component system protein [Acanthopleuribacter pedis]MBO1319498.1 hypothetical protein [Acanthopleuribacter pedis]
MKLQRAYYISRFENAFLRAKGNEFQTLFEALMNRAYGHDFLPCVPWGNRGDRKNDGFLQSERCLFQVYAPLEMTEYKAVKKIKEDFEGAVRHWRSHFHKWIFVHNAPGLPPGVMETFLTLKQTHPGIDIDAWGEHELRKIFEQLERDTMAEWFGPAPTEATQAKLGFDELQVVLEHIAGQPPVGSLVVDDVPMGKIEANALSESTAALLKAGYIKTPLVARFFDRWHDPLFGERIAGAFRARYAGLRGRMIPNRIFGELQAWAGGSQRGTGEHEVPVLAVLAYFFERCDIFEKPKGEDL